MRYGFIGLGSLGENLASCLLREGFELLVTDREKNKADRLITDGAQWREDPADLASEVDAVITCLPSPAASQSVLDTILPRMRPGATWIEMSTVGRDDILRFSETAGSFGISALEAPVTGGVHLAGRGEITVLVGGNEDLFDKHLPAFQAMGGKIFHMGPLGSASLIKVITNMLAFIHLVAGGEALMLAKRGGLDLGKAWEAIAASSGNSFVHETEGQLILNGSYDIAFTMDLVLKDLGFAMAFGEEYGVPLDLASLVEKTFRRGKESYGGAAQSPQVVKLLEDQLGTDLRAPGFPARLE